MNLTELFSGAPTRAKWRQLGEYLKGAHRIKGGVGVRVSHDPVTGFVISASPRRPSPFGIKHPWQIIDASNATDGIRVYVRPGQVSSGFGWLDAPSNMVLYDAAEEDKLYLPVVDTGWVILTVTITSGESPSVDDVVVDFVTTIPADTATTASLVIAKVTTELVESELRIVSIFQNLSVNLLHSLAFEYFSYPEYWRQLFGPLNTQTEAPA